MEFRLTNAATPVSCLLVAMVLMTGSLEVCAGLSVPTGNIEGRAPTVSGTLFLALPNGNTVSNYDVMDGAWQPDNVEVSGDTTDLTLSDLDGDCALLPAPAYQPSMLLRASWCGKTMGRCSRLTNWLRRSVHTF